MARAFIPGSRRGAVQFAPAGVEFAAPSNTTLPVITGTPRVGQTLAGTSGTWAGSPSPTYAFQWLRDGVAITGATSSTYEVTEADLGSVISFRVVASNFNGSAIAVSDDTAAVTLVAVFTVSPTISGVAQEGVTLLATTGAATGSPTPVMTLQWKRNGVAISGATGLTYLVVLADVGSVLTVTSTATNSQGTASATSDATATVIAAFSAPVFTVGATITGTATEGQTLSASSGTYTGNPTPTVAYQWLRAGELISGALSATYTLVLADVGFAISVRVTATNSQGSTSSTSTATSAVAAAAATPAFATTPSISGLAQQGQTLTANQGTATGNPTPTLTTQWKRNGSAISGETGSTYVLVLADVGSVITITVTATNTEGSASSTSAATSTVTALPDQGAYTPSLDFSDERNTIYKFMGY